MASGQWFTGVREVTKTDSAFTGLFKGGKAQFITNSSTAAEDPISGSGGVGCSRKQIGPERGTLTFTRIDNDFGPGGRAVYCCGSVWL